MAEDEDIVDTEEKDVFSDDLSDTESIDLEDHDERSKELNKLISDSNINISNTYGDYSDSVIDLEIDDSNMFLKKFKKDLTEDYILKNHPECLSVNKDEINKLVEIKKKDNVIVDKFHKTIPILTKYEKTKILGLRLKQLNNNAKPYLSFDKPILDNYLIAIKELEEKVLPFIIKRPLPNNMFEYWRLQDLDIL